MESKVQSAVSSVCMSNTSGNDSSATERMSPVYRDGISNPEADGSSAMDRKSTVKSDASRTIGKAGSVPLAKKTSASSEVKPHGKAVVSNVRVEEFMMFGEVTLGPHEDMLRFRLIHFWEARNPRTQTLIGVEMLLIDEQEAVIQGFIPPGHVHLHLKHMTAGSVYTLTNFFGSRSKTVFRVADHGITVSFSWNSVLSVLQNSPVPFPEDRFRFYSHEEFESKCDARGDLYDYVGHMKLVNGEAITDSPQLDEGDIAEKRHLLIHVQTHGGPVMKLYLWDKAATEFCKMFKSFGSTPRVILVTTVNPKRLGGTLALTSMASSRVFLDSDVQPTRDYMSWLVCNSDIANNVNAEVVTKPECVTKADLFTYMKQETAKVAWFECTATIDDVLHGSSWYYIACGGCNTKATVGPTSLICNSKKCGKSQLAGVPQYLTKISVYDKSEQALFVLLGDAGRELTGKHASELVAAYSEGHKNMGGDDIVPVPQALTETIGQTHKFIVKISDHYLTGKTQTITVTKVLPAHTPDDPIGKAADEKIRKASGSLNPDESKRVKSG